MTVHTLQLILYYGQGVMYVVRTYILLYYGQGVMYVVTTHMYIHITVDPVLWKGSNVCSYHTYVHTYMYMPVYAYT